MTISTTRSRIRTIGSAALATSVGLGIGAVSVFAASPASAATVTKDILYLCDVQGDDGMDGVIEADFADMEFKISTTAEIPATVTQGTTVPATPAGIVLTMPIPLQFSAPPVLGKYVSGNSTDTAVGFTVEGTKVDKILTAPGGTDPIATNGWSEIPKIPALGGTAWTISVNGEVPAVSVDAEATGSVTIEAPTHFTMNANGSDSASGSPVRSATKVTCDVKPGESILLGEPPILDKVTGQPTTPAVATTLTATSAPSDTASNATVNFTVAPATSVGNVTVSLNGKEIGKSAVANGAASIVIPAATLPEAKVYSLQARYTGGKGFKPSNATISVTRTTATVQPSEPAKATVGATAKGLKVGKKGQLSVAIKSDSADKSGKVTVKVGKKTLGKGKVNAKGKGKIKLKKITAKMVKKGKIKLTVIYAGNDTTAASKKNVKVKVKK